MAFYVSFNSFLKMFIYIVMGLYGTQKKYNSTSFSIVYVLFIHLSHQNILCLTQIIFFPATQSFSNLTFIHLYSIKYSLNKHQYEEEEEDEKKEEEKEEKREEEKQKENRKKGEGLKRSLIT